MKKWFFFHVKGLHYLGQMHENGMLKVAFDQITEGQMEFVELKQHFDSIVIEDGEEQRDYTILSGKTEMERNLKKQFPDDVKAIEEFFKIMKVERPSSHVSKDRLTQDLWLRGSPNQQRKTTTISHKFMREIRLDRDFCCGHAML